MNGRVFKTMRTRRNLTIKQMAAILQVSGASIQGYERAATLSLNRLEHYANILNDTELKMSINALKELLK